MLLRDDKPMVGVKQGAQFVGVLTPNGDPPGAAGVAAGARGLTISLVNQGNGHLAREVSRAKCANPWLTRDLRRASVHRHVPVPGLGDVLRLPAHRRVEAGRAGG